MANQTLQEFLAQLDVRLQEAVQFYWDAREQQQDKQTEKGTTDVGGRSAVTGGGHLAKLENLLVDAIYATGLLNVQVKIGRSGTSASDRKLELPGYYRPEKKWDMLVLSQGQLVAAIEFKSQVGPSFGNNFNNRSEEAIGSAEDFWTAHREGRFGKGSRPFLGYFFLLEDCAKVHAPVRLSEPNFPADPEYRRFSGGPSYAQRYELLTRRLLLERKYTSACLVLATKHNTTKLSEPAADLTFKSFIGDLIGHVQAMLVKQS